MGRILPPSECFFPMDSESSNASRHWTTNKGTVWGAMKSPLSAIYFTFILHSCIDLLHCSYKSFVNANKEFKFIILRCFKQMNDWSVHDNRTDWDHESFYERTLSQIWSRSVSFFVYSLYSIGLTRVFSVSIILFSSSVVKSNSSYQLSKKFELIDFNELVWGVWFYHVQCNNFVN